MSPSTEPPSAEPTPGSPPRRGWLKTMYVANILVGVPIGGAALLAPTVMRGVLGVPPGDPIHFGIASGAVPLAFGVAGVLGLRRPLRLSPVLGLQAAYKTLYLLGVVLPLLVQGQLPGFAVPLSLLFLAFIVGDLIAVPFPYLASQVSETS